MNRRTLFLLAGAGAVVLLYLGDQAYRSLIERPMQIDEGRLTKIERNLIKAQDAQIEARQAARRFEVMQRFSLPSDPELARSAYQDWILQRLQQYGLENRSVDPGQPVPVTVRSRTNSNRRRLVYHRLGFGVRAQGSLQQVTDFMFEFYQAPHLHKIRSISLNPIGNRQQVDLTINIEAIALNDCEREGELAEGNAPRMASESPEDYYYIAYRNFFSRGFSKALSNVRLTAITQDRSGAPQAWFRIGDSRERQIASIGDPLQVELFEVRLVDVQGDTAIISLDGSLIRITVGKTIGEAISSDQSTATAAR